MKLIQADAMIALTKLDDNSVDALVTDPPAGIGFMGKAWDSDKGGRDNWVGWMADVMRDVYRVMKPGAHGLVWSLPRTSHWTATALENAGFEVRDVITHVFGTGFPKSLAIDKAIDKAAGAERERIRPLGAIARRATQGTNALGGSWQEDPWETVPATEDAKRWAGWGTALKPASEMWVLIRKPISEKNVAENVLKWGTGGLNIDASRIATDELTPRNNNNTASLLEKGFEGEPRTIHPSPLGRFPANFILSHNDDCDDRCTEGCPVAELDRQSLAGGMHSAGKARIGGAKQANSGALFGVGNHEGNGTRIGDSGGASRFFYCAKTSSSERNAGLEGVPTKSGSVANNEFGVGATHRHANAEERAQGIVSVERKPQANHHPTVKSLKLMTYLIHMACPPGGVVLDPFMGSGSTGVAAKQAGFDFIGIELEPEYFKIAEMRITSRPETPNSAVGT